MKKLELQDGDEFRGNSTYGSVHQYRNGRDLCCIVSGMKLTQNLKGFFAYVKKVAKGFGFKILPLKDPWIVRVQGS